MFLILTDILGSFVLMFFKHLKRKKMPFNLKSTTLRLRSDFYFRKPEARVLIKLFLLKRVLKYESRAAIKKVWNHGIFGTEFLPSSL